MPRATPTPRHPALLPRHGWRVVGAAFLAGLVLFLLVWLGSREQASPQADATAPGEPAARIEPLPRPLPAASGASDMPDAGPRAERPQLVEAPEPLPQALPEALAEEGATLPGELPPGVGPGIAPPFPRPGSQPTPLPGSSPSPDYPVGALRRREQGTVVLRVEVDHRGRPAGVALLQRSGSRDLDRAAQAAVRRWRFQPAMVDGQPAPGSVEVPVEFRLD